MENNLGLAGGLVNNGLVGDKRHNIIKVTDDRKTDAVTGKPISDKDRLHANIDPNFASEIIISANRNKIDPYIALAIAHQESGYGNTEGGLENPYSIDNSPEEAGKNWEHLNAKGGIQLFMELFNKKLDLANRLGKKDEASKIQAWNGYGTISRKSEDNSSKYYGIDVGKKPLNMNENPVYGKRVIDNFKDVGLIMKYLANVHVSHNNINNEH